MVAESKRADWIAVAVLAAVLTVLLWPVISGAACFSARDLTAYYFPMKKGVHDLFWRGEFPSWDPLVAAGQPAAANPEYEIFYPGQWPIFLRDYFLGYRLHIVLHFYVAALGMYALMRSLGAASVASLLTAFTFVLGGPFLSAVSLLPSLFSLTWLPVTLLFMRLAIRNGRPRDAALAALSFGMQALVLDPALILATAALVAGYAAFRSATEKRLRPILMGAKIGIAGGCVAAVQVIPTIDHIRQSVRSRGFGPDLVGAWSMPISRLVEVVQPHWLGHAPFSGGPYWGLAAYPGDPGPFLASLYMGWALVVAVLTGLVMRSRAVIITSAGACLAWFVALGRHTPLLSVLTALHIPIPLRFPERAAFIAAFFLAIGAGCALDRLIAEPAWRRRATFVALVLAIAAAAAVIAVHTRTFAVTFLRMWDLQTIDLTLLPLVQTDWTAVAVRAAILTFLLALAPRVPAKLLGPVLVVFVIADLYPLGHEVAPLHPREFFSMPPVARELRQPSEDYRLFVEPEWSSGSVRQRYFADKRLAPWVFRNGMFPRVPAAWGFRTVLEHDIDLTNLAWTNDFVEAMWRVRRAGRRDWAEIFMAMSNVGYRAAFRPFEAEVMRHPDVRTSEPTIFVPIAGNARYYFADEIALARTPAEFVDRLVRGTHSRRVAFVATGAIRAGSGDVVRVYERSNRVELTVRAKSEGLLVAVVTAQKWWRATVDGRPVPIERVNLAYQGVVVPAGEHRVEFRYVNPLIGGGAMLSLASLVLIAVVAWRDCRAAAPAVPNNGA